MRIRDAIVDQLRSVVVDSVEWAWRWRILVSMGFSWGCKVVVSLSALVCRVAMNGHRLDSQKHRGKQRKSGGGGRCLWGDTTTEVARVGACSEAGVEAYPQKQLENRTILCRFII